MRWMMNSVELGLTFISVAKWNFDKHARFPGHESVVDESEEGPLQWMPSYDLECNEKVF